MPSERPRGAAGQLVDVVVTGIEFQRHWGIGHEEDGGGLSYVIDSSTTASVSEDRTGALVQFEATVEWRIDGEPTVDGPFDLRVDLEAVFNWHAPEAPVEGIEGWLEFNSYHLLWPYLRAEIARITMSAGLPPLTIYTVAVPRPHLGRESAQPVADDSDS